MQSRDEILCVGTYDVRYCVACRNYVCIKQ